MSRENSDEIATPSRRALLKAAAAGGAFAVPFIASFSMDAASAQSRVYYHGSSNQFHTSNQTHSSNQFHHTSNQFHTSNMYCSNMTVRTSTFHAELHHGHGGPNAGLAGLEFTAGRDEIFYELVLDGKVREWSLDGRSFGFLSVHGGARVGTIGGSSLTCSASTVYAALEAGGVTITVDLTGGKQLTGTFAKPGQHGPGGSNFGGRFGFLGQG